LTYTYNDGLINDVSLTNRDTVVYNSDGTVKLYKVSKASSDWSVDSIISVDSVVSIDANTYEKYSYTYSSGKLNINK